MGGIREVRVGGEGEGKGREGKEGLLGRVCEVCVEGGVA